MVTTDVIKGLEGWERVSSLPDSRSGKGAVSRWAKFHLEPGQIVRQRTEKNTSSGDPVRQFRKQGRTDYHAGTRRVDGVLWLYVWRDAAPAS